MSAEAVAEEFLLTPTPSPSLWSRLSLRWRIWRRNPELMQSIARGALMRTGVCDESDSLVRIAWDRETGGLIIMIYLAHFDHAAWIMSRHIEGYLVRQFKGTFGIPVHSVHVDVIRSRAFKELPPIKSASSLRAVLRQRRGETIKSTGTTGRRIVHHSQPPKEDNDPFPATSQMGLDDGTPAARSGRPADNKAADPAVSRARSPQVINMITDEYLSVPGYEISEVNFEEFLNSMPTDSSMPNGAPDSQQPAQQPGQPAAARGAKPGAPSTFLAESDLMKRDR